MKKNKKFKNKIAMLLCGAVLPVSAGGMIFSLNAQATADAANASSTASYLKSYVKEVSLSNNNFNSSSSSTLSTSPTGWTKQLNDGKTTAGVINTGSSFQSYMTGTYRLSSNPLAKATDKHILMINSKTSNSGDYSAAKQGYKSSAISLEANSYYSFQVSFKSDTNYSSRTTYVKKGEVSSDVTISKTTFNGGSETNITPFGDESYISFTYKNKQYYLQKQLTEHSTIAAETEIEASKAFYEDENHIGVMFKLDGEEEETPVYFAVDSIEKSEDKIIIKNGTISHTCNITYDAKNKNYVVKGATENFAGTTYFESKTEYDPISATSFGSIYLSGLKDENGKDIKAEYLQVSSKDWTTFYFFVATGNTSQSVNLELWLGAKNMTTTGVAFFDDCHVIQYSENAFWKTYQQYYGKSYTQDFITDGEESDSKIETLTIQCTSLVDLRNDKALDYGSHNFDFEAGIFHENVSSLQNWKKAEQSGGNAQIFDVSNAQYFKSKTGYDFVGSNLSCEVELDGDKVELITENKYALGLWAENNFVKVTSDEVSINSNEIYKIKAYYKISKLTNGNVYMFVEEKDNVLSTYNLSDKQYAVAAETASSGVSSNAENNFVNNYGVIEFYVKGGALYNSSINLSLGLGKTDESATGCVLFDNVTIEKASSEQFSSASNKLELGKISNTPTISNGNFNNVKISDEDTRPYSPENWTITKGNGICYGGVINTDALQYAEYEKLYQQYASSLSDAENPYYWATWNNPKNVYGKDEPDNILMLANMTKTWQKIKSDKITLSANTTYKLSFDFKTYGLSNGAGFKVTLYGEDNFKLYESDPASSNSWNKFDIYLKSFSGASEVYVEIELDTTEGQEFCLAYFDNFRLDSGETAPEFGNNVVDMTDFYLNLPTNDISTSDEKASTTPAYTSSVSSGSASGMSGGIVKSEKFDENSNFTIYDEENPEKIDKEENVFFFTSSTAGSYVLQSNFNLDLTANNFYKLSFKLKSLFNGTLDKDKKYSYGATVGLTGFDYATELKSDEEYTTYTLYFNPNEDKNSKLYIALICDANETAGAIAIYDFQFAESNEDDFNLAKTTTQGKDYDVNKDKVFISSATDDETEEPDDTDKDTPTGNSQGFDWLLIPSLIFGLAIIVAVVGYFLRKIKIKKIQIKKRESYDRKTSLNVDAIKNKARKQQEANIAEVQKTINKFEAELQVLEKEHKQKVVALRENDQKEVSKTTDKEFKRFAQKRTVIAEKIDSLKKQIDDMKSAEYLLNLERKIYAQDEMKQKTLEKASKKANKDKESTVKEEASQKPKK